jgi:SAM-dependent methyltransferase
MTEQEAILEMKRLVYRLLTFPRKLLVGKYRHVTASGQIDQAQVLNLQNEINALIKNMLKTRSIFFEQRLKALPPVHESLAPIPGHITYEQALKEMEKIVPHAYSIWRELLEVNATSYLGFPIHSCSVKGHPMAEAFSNFLKGYIFGTVLDIGCGPQGLPSYLEGYPVDRIAGIDPLPAGQEHPFVFVQTVAEFLPWKDKTFSTVVVGTSLDHVLLLDKSLREFRRVLKDDGVIVLWIGAIPGSKKYNPYDPAITNVDEYHLFHFDQPWFEEVMREDFIMEECVAFSYPELSRFYAFRPRV